jgi:hypothetical protein
MISPVLICYLFSLFYDEVISWVEQDGQVSDRDNELLKMIENIYSQCPDAMQKNTKKRNF